MNTLHDWMLIRELIVLGFLLLLIIAGMVLSRLTGRRESAAQGEAPTLPAGLMPPGASLRHRAGAAGSVANDSEVDPTPTPAPRRAA